MLQGVARLSHQPVRAPEKISDRCAQPRVPVRRARLAGIVQIPAVNREHVGNSIDRSKHLTHGTARHHEVRIDYVKRPGAPQGQAAQRGGGHIGEHRGKIRHRELTAKENRCPHDAHAALQTLRREPERLRSEHGHRVAARQFSRQSGHDHPSAAAQRRVLIVAKKDFHPGLGLQYILFVHRLERAPCPPSSRAKPRPARA